MSQIIYQAFLNEKRKELAGHAPTGSSLIVEIQDKYTVDHAFHIFCHITDSVSVLHSLVMTKTYPGFLLIMYYRKSKTITL